MNPKVVAIVPAAGSGKRLQARQEKAFVNLGGKPLVVYALKALNSSAYIDAIIVAVKTSSIKRLKGIIGRYGISKASIVISGGKTRAESVKNCFNIIGPACEIVLIHDAARPFLSQDCIKNSVSLARKFGACVTSIRQTDTVKSADKNMFVKKTLDRDSLWRAQTPQAFKYSMLKKAYSKADALSHMTDDASILENCGKKVKILEGSPRNIKVTTREDLKIAEALL